MQIGARTKDNLEHVTIMPTFCADGALYKPVLVFPGKLYHFRKVIGVHQSLHSFLAPCYLFQQEPTGVNTSIVHELAKGFLAETEQL